MPKFDKKVIILQFFTNEHSKFNKQFSKNCIFFKDFLRKKAFFSLKILKSLDKYVIMGHIFYLYMINM